MKHLAGKAALVTGAGRGIGRGIAAYLAEHGVKVAVNYVTSEASANALVKELTDAGQEAVAVQADVSDVAQVKRMVEQVAQTFGGIDILVNNAAVDPVVDFFDVTEALWDRVIDSNLKGAFFCTQACAPYMKRAGKGKVINIGSVHGSATMHGYAAYAASKGGMNALTRQLALDLAPFRINVNTVAPGTIEVEKYSSFGWFDSEFEGRKIPLGRIGTPADIAPLVAFLATEEADYITGQVFTVDGGASARFFYYADPVVIE